MPRLPIDRIRRQRPSNPSARRVDAPLVIAAKIANALRLTAVSDEAAQRGLTPGMPLADARAIHPALDVVEGDPDADGRLLSAIADWCERFTPFVALDHPHGLLLDLTGGAHLFGGEEALRSDIVRRLSGQSLASTAAIAGTIDAARALSRFTAGGLVRPGDEMEAVGLLPVAALNLDPQTTRALQRAGLYMIADVVARPRAPLAARFGSALLDTLDRVIGRSDRPLTPRRPSPSLFVTQRFAEPIADEATVRCVLSRLAGDLSGILEREGQGLRRVEAAFFRADGAVLRVAAETGRPVRDPALIARLFRERLDGLADPLDPGFGFDLIRLAALAVAPLAPKAERFDGRGEDERALAMLIDRLGARFGVRRVVRFCAQNTHVPEATAITVPAVEVARSLNLSPLAGRGPSEARGEGASPINRQSARAPHPSPLPARGERGWPLQRGPGEPPARPMRLFDPPQPIEAAAEVPDGPPVHFRWRRALHKVVKAEGPERIALDWWRIEDRPLTRDYFRVEDKSGCRFWLFRQGLFEREVEHPRWFLHGLFA